MSPTNNVTPDKTTPVVPTVTPKTNNRAANWSVAEDEQLCKSWLTVSEDPITGREQKGKAMWEHIKEDFDRALCKSSGRPERALAGLCSRWNQIRKKVIAYCGCLETALDAPDSGKGLVGTTGKAMGYYYKATGELWSMNHCYVILESAPRWKSRLPANQAAEGSSSSTSDSSSALVSANLAVGYVSRPMDCEEDEEVDRGNGRQNLERLLVQVLESQTKILKSQIAHYEETAKRKQKEERESLSQDFLDLKYMMVNPEEIKGQHRRAFIKAMQDEAYERWQGKRRKIAEEESVSKDNDDDDFNT